MKIKKQLKKYAVITAGALLFGAGVSLFIDPNNLAPGGVSGLSILINRLVPIETGTLFFLLNIPLLLLGMWKFGFRFICSTCYAIVIVSASTNLLKNLPPLTSQPLLGAIFGGMLVAVGIGAVLRMGASTGGTDIIVKYLKLKKPYLQTGTIFLLIDAGIILLGGVVFGNIESVLYSILSAAVTSQVLNYVLYGGDEARMFYIISDACQQITERILAEIDIGVTHLYGNGAYEGREKQVILCVVKKRLAYRVEEIVKQEDAAAFMIISNATEIYGEGYKNIFAAKI